MRRIGLLLFLVFTISISAGAQAPNTISTYAGGGANTGAATGAYLSQSHSVVRDSSGNTYIAAAPLEIVYKVNTSGTISIYAGTGIAGWMGDGAAATAAQLDYPTGLALDSAGNLYITDTNNNRIRKVTASTGNISTVAGSGTEYNGAGYYGGYSGDGGAAIDALLNQPYGVTVDSAGNFYIADTGNQVVRLVNAASGVISTYAGTGAAGYSGDNGAATSATFRAPSSVSIDSTGNLFIADRNNCVVRKVDNTTQHIITTYAGKGGACGFSGDGGPAASANINTPRGVYVDAAGNLFIADTFNSRIRKVDNTTQHNISTVAGNGSFCATPAGCGDGGTATSAALNVPYYAFEDAAGNILISDLGDMRVRIVTSGSAPVIANYAGGGTGGDGGPATGGMLALPYIANVDGAGNLFILDSQTARVQRVDVKTKVVTTYGGNGVLAVPGGPNGDGGQATAASLNYPTGMTIDSDGNLYIVDFHAYVVREINASTGIIATVAGNGLQCGAAGNSNQPPDCGDDSRATSASLLFPEGVAVDVSGNIYISDAGLNRIRIFQVGGDIEPYAGTGAAGYVDGPLNTAQFNAPFGMAFGPGEVLYVADGGNNLIRAIDTENQLVSTYAFNGEPTFGGDGSDALDASMDSPAQVALDPAGNLFVGGGYDNVVRRIDAYDLSVITVAGNVTNLDGGFSGDGGAPNLALISNFGLTVDANENLYIADAGNNRIRIVPMVPVASWSPDSLVPFAPLLQGQTSAAQFIDFSNTGLNDLIVNAQSVPLDFTATTSCNASPQGGCSILVTFAPAAGGPTGTVGGNLVLTTNDPNNPTITFALSGTVATTGFLLTVNVVGSGTVFDLTDAINCPQISCSANYASGTVATLFASPNPGFTFTSWSSNCIPVTDFPTECTVTMSQAQTVTATFTVGTGGGGPSLTVADFGNGTGTITSSPAGINCPTTCTATFQASVTSVTLTATPQTGSVFVGWADGFCTSQTGNQCVINFFFDGLTTTAVFSVPRQPFTKGDVFIGSGSGMIFEYSPAGTLVQVLPPLGVFSFAEFGGGLAFDANGTLYAADVSNTETAGVETFASNGTGPTAFGGTAAIGASSVRVDTGGNVFVGLASNTLTGNLLEYGPGKIAVPSAHFFPSYSNQDGILAFEIGNDDATVFYTLGGASIYSYNTALALQNPDVTDALPGFYGGDLRQLPDSSLLVADGNLVVRMNSTTGAIIQTYQPADFSFLLGLTLDPDGVDFWTNDAFTGIVYKINIAGGQIVSQFDSGLGDTSFAELAGLGAMAVYGSPISGGQDLTVSLAGAGTGSVSSNTGGIACPTICTANFGAGTQVTLTAAPATGSTFGGWSGNCTGTGTCTVTMNSAQAVTATFNTTVTYALTVTPAGTGSGTVSSSTGGILCPSTCSANFASGQQVTLSETPNSGSTFAGWSGACTGTGSCVVTMTAAESVTATFNTTTFALTVTPAGAGSGTVTSAPSGISCPSTCSANFTSGQQVTLTQAANTGSTFAGWSGTCTGTGSCTVTMNAAESVTATFNVTVTTFALTVTETGTGFGTVVSTQSGINCTSGSTVGCSANFNSGTTVVLNETPASGSTFAGWSGACTGTSSTCSVTMNAAEAVTATFNTTATNDIRSALVPFTDDGTAPVTVTWNPAFADTNYTAACTAETTPSDFLLPVITGRTATTMTVIPTDGGATPGTLDCIAIPDSDTSDIRHGRVAFSDDPRTVTVPWNPVFPDTNYTVACTVETEAGIGGGFTSVISDLETGFVAVDNGQFDTGTMHCIAVPDSDTGTVRHGRVSLSGQSQTVTVPWNSPFPNPSYAAACSEVQFDETSSDAAIAIDLGMKLAASVGVVDEISFGTIHCLGLTAAPTLLTLSVTPSPGTVQAGSTLQFTVTGNYSDGSTQNLTTAAAWSSSNVDVATISNVAGTQGLATGVQVGDPVTITATDGSLTGTATLTVTAAPQFTLTVSLAGTGAGTVTSEPEDFNCPGVCSVSFTSGTMVTLLEAPADGSVFAGWSGACSGTGTCTVTMNAAENVTATFNLPPPNFTLSVSVSGTGSGAVTGSSGGIDCTGGSSSGACTASYVSGAVVTLTATPGSGSAFAGWGGACSGTASTCSVTMNAAETVTATFNTSTFTFTTGPGYSTTISTTPGGNIVVGFTLSSTTPTTVGLGCTSSAPQFLTCLITPTEVQLSGNGPSQVAIVLTSYCQGSAPGMPGGPTPGIPGGIVGVMLLGMALCGVALAYRGRRRMALSYALLLFAAVGGSACGNLPKGTAGATPPGNYTLTVTATVPNQAPQIVQLTVNVQ